MHFDIVSRLQSIEIIAAGVSVRDRRRLQRLYGTGRWRKMKGVAEIRYADGTLCLAELHWYEAHGRGRREFKVKTVLRLL